MCALLFQDHEILSRFRGVYLVGLPDKQARYNLLKTLLKDVQHNLSDKDIMHAAEKTEGYVLLRVSLISNSPFMQKHKTTTFVNPFLNFILRY